jgi:hypothetical protein
MDTAAQQRALAISADKIIVTTGDDDWQVKFFPADCTKEAYAAAAARSLKTYGPVRAIECYPGGSTVSTFVSGAEVSVTSRDH